jgi:hypothetical protein
MTKVQIPVALSTPLNEGLMSRLTDLYRIYGILGISVEAGREKLKVEYDATRLTPKDVEAALAQAGVPVIRSF